MTKSENGNVKRNKIMKIAGALLIMAAVMLVIALIVTTNDSIRQWYSQYQDILYRLETKVASINYQYLILIFIFILFTIKSFAPVITVPGIFMLSGLVFPTPSALLVNIAGLIFMFTLKYKYGRNRGGGNAGKMIGKMMDKSDTLRSLIEHNGEGNPWLLFIFRLVPGFPINSISQIYGSMNFNYKRFIIISLAGMAPKIFSYTFIGRSLYDPLSWSFFLPIIIMFTISGASILGLNALLNYFEKS